MPIKFSSTYRRLNLYQKVSGFIGNTLRIKSIHKSNCLELLFPSGVSRYPSLILGNLAKVVCIADEPEAIQIYPFWDGATYKNPDYLLLYAFEVTRGIFSNKRGEILVIPPKDFDYRREAFDPSVKSIIDPSSERWKNFKTEVDQLFVGRLEIRIGNTIFEVLDRDAERKALEHYSCLRKSKWERFLQQNLGSSITLKNRITALIEWRSEFLAANENKWATETLEDWSLARIAALQQPTTSNIITMLGEEALKIPQLLRILESADRRTELRRTVL